MNGTWADHTAIQGIARMLQRDILIVTSKEESTKLGSLTTLIPGGEGLPVCASPAESICLGHQNELHYISLEPTVCQTEAEQITLSTRTVSEATTEPSISALMSDEVISHDIL